ncbi:MAG: hypothetical protein V4508_12960 [Pseudomonadota bacterium]
MKLLQVRGALACAGVVLLCSIFPVHAQPTRDGSHDFDFARGVWHTHITRVLDPFNGGTQTVTSDGMKTATPIFGGGGWIEELEVDDPSGHWKGATLFLYNSKSGQWSQSYVDSESAEVGVPEIGEFKDGRGEFYATKKRNGRNVLVRGVWSDVTASSHRYEISFSQNGGRTWAAVFKAYLTRIK